MPNTLFPAPGAPDLENARSADSLSAGELREIKQEIGAAFQPRSDPDSQVVLLEVDPRRLHVYWRAGVEDLRRARQELRARQEPANLILRLHDVAYMDFSGANPHASRDIFLDSSEGGDYIKLPNHGRGLVAELGLRGDLRRLEVLARSEILHLPALRSAIEPVSVPAKARLAPPGFPREFPLVAPCCRREHIHTLAGNLRRAIADSRPSLEQNPDPELRWYWSHSAMFAPGLTDLHFPLAFRWSSTGGFDPPFHPLSSSNRFAGNRHEF